ncbi:MAG: efflux RND transporter periplasmic adaptor subunit [Planctomycetota bacterium]|jgi:multidrug efflux pump subunit AcrA (membrane-fusion protein)
MEARTVVPAVLALAIGGALAVWYRGDGDVPKQDPEPAGNESTTDVPEPGKERPWRAEPVRRATIDSFEALSARIEAPDPVAVRSDVNAFITELLVKPGDVVRKDQLLFRLNSKSWEDELARAREAKDADRVKEIEQSLEIRAPADGVVHEVHVLKGDRPPLGMEGEPPRPMLVLFDWRKLRFHAAAAKDLLPLLGEGARVRVQSPDGLTSEGIIDRRLEPEADGTIPIIARPVQPPETTPNLKGEAAVLLPTGKKHILVIPATAVERKDGRHLVQKIAITGERVPTFIVMGAAVGSGMVEVKSGLGLNESIAVPKR